MKAVLKQTDPIYYVDEADFISFIVENSDYAWNHVCKLVRDEVFNEEGRTYYTEKPIGKNYSEFCIEWMGNFYEAHPWLTKIMFVFDD